MMNEVQIETKIKVIKCVLRQKRIRNLNDLFGLELIIYFCYSNIIS